MFTSSEHPDLPKHSFDYIFLRNVTHHLPNRINYFKSLSEALKSDGKIVIIEYDGSGGAFSFHKLTKHFIPTSIILEEMKKAGYILKNNYDFLPGQSFTIYTKI